METSGDLASVVIPTYFRKSFLTSVISPLLEDPGTGEVIVVIDGSSDGSLDFLTRWSETESRIRPIFQENMGDNAARLRGAREARFDVIVFLDDDVQAGPHLIASHAQLHRGHPKRLALGYMPVRVPQRREPGQVTTLLYAGDYENACALFDADPDKVFTNFWAGNFSLGREVAVEILAVPSSRLGYHSDLQLGLRCREAGLEPVFDRSLVATHNHHRSVQAFAGEARRSGIGRAQLSREFPSFAVSLDPLVSLSPRAGLVARYLGQRRMRRIAAPIVAQLCVLSGRLRIWRMETFAAQTLRIIELTAGFSGSH